MLKVKIIHPDKLLFEGEAEYVVAPGVTGALGIMPGHTPMFAELVKGELHIAGMHEETLTIEAGILKVRNDTVTILVGIE